MNMQLRWQITLLILQKYTSKKEKKTQRRESGRGQTTETPNSNVHAQSLKHIKRKLFGNCLLLLWSLVSDRLSCQGCGWREEVRNGAGDGLLCIRKRNNNNNKNNNELRATPQDTWTRGDSRIFLMGWHRGDQDPVGEGGLWEKSCAPTQVGW